MRAHRLIAAGTMVLAACTPSDQTTPSGELPAAPVRQLYINFDGATVHPGPEKASAGTSLIVSETVVIPAFVNRAFPDIEREQVLIDTLAKTSQFFEPFDVAIYLDRPPAGEYTMILVGGGDAEARQVASGVSGGSVAIAAPRDCNQDASGEPIFDVFGDQDIAFVFADNAFLFGDYREAVHGLAATIARAAGHTYGLASTVDARYDVMAIDPFPRLPDTFGTGRAFGSPGYCNGGRTQNSVDILTSVLGPAQP